MGKQDAILKEYLSNPEIFADLFNGFLFEGEQVLKKDQIQPLDSAATVLVQERDGKPHAVQKYRDIICKAAMGMQFILLGVENQMNIHYAMPVRGMMYDALSYTQQVEKIGKQRRAERGNLKGDEYLSGLRKEDKLLPTITIVLYYGSIPWDGSIDLYDMLELGEHRERLEKYIPNYRINLLKINEAEELKRYRTGLRELFGVLRYQKDIRQLQEHLEANQERYRSLDKGTYQVIQSLTKMELMESEHDQGGGRDMIQAFEQLKKQYLQIGETRGIQIGETRGIQIGETRGIKIGETRGIQIGEIKGILQTMREYGSTKENAIQKVFSRYPNNEAMIIRLADEIFAD